MSEAKPAKRSLHHRLYDWVLHWSGHRHASIALAGIALAESSFFPLPPDVLLVAMCVAKPNRFLRYALITAVASVIGGMLGYWIGWGLWGAVEQTFYDYVPGFSPAIYGKVSGWYDQWDFWIVFAAGFTPIPYKVFTIGAGVAQINFFVFVLASTVARSARFLLVASLIRIFGPKIMPFIEKYLGWLSLAFVVLLVGGFILLGWLGGH